jgi:hypothetical protein
MKSKDAKDIEEFDMLNNRFPGLKISFNMGEPEINGDQQNG